ncbi:hypothetical protein MKX01_035218 [Papaver californicum]|nr:hypothetical protein MKX01_035218 [Papaver californicum]
MITCKKVSNLSFTSSPILPSQQFNYRSRNHIKILSFSWLLQSNSHSSSPLRNKYKVFSSAERNNTNSRSSTSGRSSTKEQTIREAEYNEEGEERKVHCEVDVISWRERRIKATVLVNADIDSVWDSLTDYERLADFIPNLICSGRIPCPHPGRIWLEQRGLQGALYWHIEARVVLDLQEFPNAADGRELHFSMVDGDFKKFEGKWYIKSGTRSCTTDLSYEVNVIPRFNFPAIFLERIIRSDLPVNLQAVARRSERNSEMNLLAASKDAFASPYTHLVGALSQKDDLLSNEVKNYSNTSVSPLPPSSSDLSSNWGAFGKVCGLDRPCMVDEVHFRRFDGLLENGGGHRCVVASITVKSPVREVWNVLTAYEKLPEIVPNLAICKILSRENNKVRILQEGCKGLLYMVLHARVVLDLCEKLEEEISFKQVEGDFDSFWGRWSLEQLGTDHTQLKYIVESKMHRDSFLSEAIVEEVIYEDLPSNLCAIRDFIEKREAKKSSEACENFRFSEENIVQNVRETVRSELNVQASELGSSNTLRKKPRVPGLQRDIEVLKAELLTFISQNGQEGFMPMRKQLRLHGRIDIEKAITRMGGFRKIATALNLSLAYKHRKPKGYWDNLENLQEEISRFQRSWGMDPAYMPSRKSFERAGRYDIARALEKWGGLHEVSRLLLLKVRYPSRQVNLGRDKKTDDDDAAASDNGKDATEENMPYSKPYVSQDTEKWLQQLKHLDVNWME